MTTAQVNYINIGLMVLSAIIAFYLPFELTLFSYAVLGPLHYLTELSWLQKRQFFMPGKKDYFLLAAFALVILSPALLKALYPLFASQGADGNVIYHPRIVLLYQQLKAASKITVVATFISAAILAMVKDRKKRIVAVLVTLIVVVLLRHSIVTAASAVLLLTLGHVFGFTGAFILAGALKTRDISGYLSFVVFVLCAVVLVTITYIPPSLSSGYIIDNYKAGFASINRQIFSTILGKNATDNDIYFSRAGILMTRFIAYAYTYHYLNWFSKTSVIRWHKIPKLSAAIILLIWIVALAIYARDYKAGLLTLYYLSALHVIFEFPLNFVSFRDIGRGVRSLVSGNSKSKIL